MDLIERYLAAIGRQLPAKQAGDIKAELRDVLMSRVEEQEERLRRPLDRGELEALLLDFGNPLVVAGRYRRIQHLIGPEVFPFWWATVKVMLAVVAGIYFVLIMIGALAHTTEAQFNQKIPSVVVVMIYLFGLITLVFLAFERFGKTGFLSQWKPSRLPPARGKRRSPFELAAEIGWNLVFLAWWLGAFRFRDILPTPYPDVMSVSLAPVWFAWKWPIVAYAAAEIAADAVAIAVPGWVTTNAAILAVRYLFGIGVLSAILQAGHWVVVSGAALSEHAHLDLQANFDLGMRIGISVTIAGMALRIALEAWRAYSARQAVAGPVLA